MGWGRWGRGKAVVFDYEGQREDARARRAGAAARRARSSAREIHHALDVARAARGRVPDDDSPRTIKVGDAVASVERAQRRAEGFVRRANAAGQRGDVGEAEAFARSVERCAREAKAAAAEAVRAAR